MSILQKLREDAERRLRVINQVTIRDTVAKLEAKVVENVPLYNWEHTPDHVKEAFRTRKLPEGRTSDDFEHEVLRLQDMLDSGVVPEDMLNFAKSGANKTVLDRKVYDGELFVAGEGKEIIRSHTGAIKSDYVAGEHIPEKQELIDLSERLAATEFVEANDCSFHGYRVFEFDNGIKLAVRPEYGYAVVITDDLSNFAASTRAELADNPHVKRYICNVGNGDSEKLIEKLNSAENFGDLILRDKKEKVDPDVVKVEALDRLDTYGERLTTKDIAKVLGVQPVTANSQIIEVKSLLEDRQGNRPYTYSKELITDAIVHGEYTRGRLQLAEPKVIDADTLALSPEEQRSSAIENLRAIGEYASIEEIAQSMDIKRFAAHHYVIKFPELMETRTKEGNKCLYAVDTLAEVLSNTEITEDGWNLH